MLIGVLLGGFVFGAMLLDLFVRGLCAGDERWWNVVGDHVLPQL